MKKHYRVQSVLLSTGQVAVTLNPVEWIAPDPSKGLDDMGIPEGWVDAEPEDEDAEPLESGGSKTELRFKTSDSMFLPGEFVTLGIERTEHHWQPGADED